MLLLNGPPVSLLLPMPADDVLRQLLVDSVMAHHRRTGSVCVLNYWPDNAVKRTQFVLYGSELCLVSMGRIPVSAPGFTYKWVMINDLNPQLTLNMTAPGHVLASLIDFLNE